MRIDKWLWVARFYKSRSLATEAVNGGKIWLNDKHAKPSTQVAVGDKVYIRRQYEEMTIVVLQLQLQRLSAVAAKTLYQETEESLQQRETLNLQKQILGPSFEKSFKKPGKKDRKILINLKHSQT